MRARVPKMALAVLVLAAAACQSPDVGQPCQFRDWSPPPNPVDLFTNGGSDFFEMGNLGCDGLVCIVSPVPAGSQYASGGYCSKPCVSNSDCYESDTGLVCRQMVLDPVFLEKLDAATRERYLSDVQFSSYCAVPAR